MFRWSDSSNLVDVHYVGFTGGGSGGVVLEYACNTTQVLGVEIGFLEYTCNTTQELGVELGVVLEYTCNTTQVLGVELGVVLEYTCNTTQVQGVPRNMTIARRLESRL